MEGDKSDPHKFIPLLFNSHSILTGHYYTNFKLPSETYGVLTRSQTKAVGMQMPKEHGADKLVDSALKHETN